MRLAISSLLANRFFPDPELLRPGVVGAPPSAKAIRSIGMLRKPRPSERQRVRSTSSSSGSAAAAVDTSEVLGWVAIATEELGEQHVQLYSPPLPSSASE